MQALGLVHSDDTSASSSSTSHMPSLEKLPSFYDDSRLNALLEGGDEHVETLLSAL